MLVSRINWRLRVARSRGEVRSPSSIRRLEGGSPWGERKIVCVIPSSRARVFIRSTKASREPAR
jgi:hypothetical protein